MDIKGEQGIMAFVTLASLTRAPPGPWWLIWVTWTVEKGRWVREGGTGGGQGWGWNLEVGWFQGCQLEVGWSRVGGQKKQNFPTPESEPSLFDLAEQRSFYTVPPFSLSILSIFMWPI